MKRIIVLIGFVFLALTSCKKEPDIGRSPCGFSGFEYSQDEPRQFGELRGDYVLIGSDTSNSNNTIREFIKSKDYFDQNSIFELPPYRSYGYKYIGVKLSKTCDCEEISWILNEIKQSPIIVFAHYTFYTDAFTEIISETMEFPIVDIYSNIFNVQLKDTNDLTDFNNTVHATNTRFIEQNRYKRDWYLVCADKNSNGDAVQMANYFYETGFFKASRPSSFKISVK